jgi:hypothetical protein
LRSLYYFREQVTRYMQEKGINLIEKAFEQVTGQQFKAYQLNTGKQRPSAFAERSSIPFQPVSYP